MAAELEPLFGQLAEVERQCDSIQDAAHQNAAAIDAETILRTCEDDNCSGREIWLLTHANSSGSTTRR